MKDKVFRIIPKVQTYAWGKIGSESKAASLAAGGTVNFEIKENEPYAELWMGTHPNAPSTLNETGDDLKTVLSSSPELLSTQIYKKYKGDLPFLLKVLSINKALSIQSHPDKKLAEYLYNNFPTIYKDNNHKPEMAVGITPFEGLCGFRPLQEIKKNILDYPEIKIVIGEENVKNFFEVIDKSGNSTLESDIKENKEALKKLYRALMEQKPEIVTIQLQQMVERIKKNSSNLPQKGTLDELIIRVENQYPNDIGVFSILLLNYVSLQPGEALYLAANEPHAYLSGDCIECMATSDNVVRAGLTPKFKDVNTLIEMLTYNYGSADSQIVQGESFNGSSTTRIYDPPIDEFTILRTLFPEGNNKSESFEGVKGPSILIVTEGHARVINSESVFDACKGSIFFVGANTKITLENVDNKETIIFRAFCTLKQCHL